MHRHSVEPVASGCAYCAVAVATLDDIRSAIAGMDDEGYTAGGQRVRIMAFLTARIRRVQADGYLPPRATSVITPE